MNYILSSSNEEWKVIEKSNGNFFISNLGRVKSIHKDNGEKIVRPLLYKGRKPIKHKVVFIKIKKHRKYSRVTIALEMLRAFKKNPYGDKKFIFIDGNPNNITLGNVEYLTSYRMNTSRQKYMSMGCKTSKQILKYVDGDTEAISELIERLWPKVSLSLRYWAKNYETCDIDNYVQEGILKTLSFLRKGLYVQNERALRKYIFITAKRMAILEYRKRNETRMEYDFNIVDKINGNKYTTQRR